MKKAAELWTIADLEDIIGLVDFPEYQREPNVWSKQAKQRLLDSILRGFDIASLYMYVNDDGSYDCIDGRQRIGAILSFLKKNDSGEDNGFPLHFTNEIIEDQGGPFAKFEGWTYEEVVKDADDQKDDLAKRLLDRLLTYPLTIISLSDSAEPDEFNLQFTRLNLGTILNSGERLHAMVGEMRDTCFDDKAGLGQHKFFAGIRIPTRRFSREQVAAQIVAQEFARRGKEKFARTRHFDLQKFFKEYAVIPEEQRAWLAELGTTLDALASVLPADLLRNRAITVSVVRLASQLGIRDESAAKSYAKFLNEFLCRLKWQIGKGLDVDLEYRYLTDFQRDVTQASVEKPAVQAREEVLARGFGFWTKTGEIAGDSGYRKRTDVDPADECKKKKA